MLRWGHEAMSDPLCEASKSTSSQPGNHQAVVSMVVFAGWQGEFIDVCVVFLSKALAKVWNKVARSARNPRPKAQVLLSPFQSKCKRSSNVASKCKQESDLDPRWTTKRRSPCECLHSCSHCPTACCTPPASITSGDDGPWGFLVPSNQIARKQPPHPPPSFSIFYLWIFSVFVHVFRCHLHFNQAFGGEVPVGGMEILF